MFGKFDEIQAMTLQDIRETKRYERTHGRADNVKTLYPPQTKFAGGIKKPDDFLGSNWKRRPSSFRFI